MQNKSSVADKQDDKIHKCIDFQFVCDSKKADKHCSSLAANREIYVGHQGRLSKGFELHNAARIQTSVHYFSIRLVSSCEWIQRVTPTYLIDESASRLSASAL